MTIRGGITKFGKLGHTPKIANLGELNEFSVKIYNQRFKVLNPNQQKIIRQRRLQELKKFK